jgi:hypothetical protein
MTVDSKTQALASLFPGCDVNDDEIIWRTGTYIEGHRYSDIVIDDALTPEQIIALAEWMKK